MPSTRTKVDRDEILVELTRSICPVCKTVIDAEINVRDDRVYMRKRCPDHGTFEALVYGDAQMYFNSIRFNKPGTIPLEFQTEVVDGCPLDCGLCPEHRQHACLGIIELNTGCNLDCPIAVRGPDSGGRFALPQRFCGVSTNDSALRGRQRAGSITDQDRVAGRA